tara:strand:- start:96 stop:518 length:423 start_codon:yes stop_codon:yes gene_type:complete
MSDSDWGNQAPIGSERGRGGRGRGRGRVRGRGRGRANQYNNSAKLPFRVSLPVKKEVFYEKLLPILKDLLKDIPAMFLSIKFDEIPVYSERNDEGLHQYHTITFVPKPTFINDNLITKWYECVIELTKATRDSHISDNSE